VRIDNNDSNKDIKCRWAESEDKELKTYGDIYNEFCDKFPLAEVEDFRPANEWYVSQLSKGIPNAIIVWLKDGTKVIYIAESEG
jgi:hypothetical protein